MKIALALYTYYYYYHYKAVYDKVTAKPLQPSSARLEEYGSNPGYKYH